MKIRIQILTGFVAALMALGSCAGWAATLGADNFDSYTDGTDVLGAIGHNSIIPWIKRGDTSGFDVLNLSGSDGQVGRGGLPNGGSATAYYAGHTHTDESILIVQTEVTIPSATSPPGGGAAFWGSLYLGLHQTPSSSGPTFPPLAGSYVLALRGNQDFNLFKYNASNNIEAQQPAPPNDPGGGGWTNYNGFNSTPTNHNDPAGNLLLDTTYLVALERNALTQTITCSIPEKDSGTIVGEGTFVDPGAMHTGGHASLILTGANPGAGYPDTYILDNFELSDGPDGTFDWDKSGLGNWAAQSSWDPLGGPPSSDAHTVRFASQVSGPTTVVTNEQVTVNRMEFNNGTNSYAIAGLGGVTLAQDGATEEDPRIDVVAGDHQFQAAVTLNHDTTVGIEAGSSLAFHHGLHLGGNTLLKTGEGDLAINNVLNTGGGAVQCLQGTCSGSGTVSGDFINNGGTVSPGSSHPSAVFAEGNLSVVPEPATWSLLLFGVVLSFARRCRCQKS